MTHSEKVREGRLRRKAHQLGLEIRKSRTRNTHSDDFGQYRIIARRTQGVLAGARFEMNRDDVEKYLRAVEKGRAQAKGA